MADNCSVVVGALTSEEVGRKVRKNLREKGWKL